MNLIWTKTEGENAVQRRPESSDGQACLEHTSHPTADGTGVLLRSRCIESCVLLVSSSLCSRYRGVGSLYSGSQVRCGRQFVLMFLSGSSQPISPRHIIVLRLRRSTEHESSNGGSVIAICGTITSLSQLVEPYHKATSMIPLQCIPFAIFLFPPPSPPALFLAEPLLPHICRYQSRSRRQIACFRASTRGEIWRQSSR